MAPAIVISNPYAPWGISDRLNTRAAMIEDHLQMSESWRRINRTREANQLKVLNTFREAQISEAGFAGTTGYGYDDLGREKLEIAFAKIMGAEKALVRIQISAGTHAIGLALFGVLRPGDELLSVTGMPYDTLYPVIGIGKKAGSAGSLADWGVTFRSVDLARGERPDCEAIRAALNERTRMVYIQRSRGYSIRRALLQSDIREICQAVRETRYGKNVTIFVDNCYGEFCDQSEPTEWGADLVAGSLIKNPGGGLAPSGGYVCGRADLVDMAAARLTVPGLGGEVGPSLGYNRQLTQGIYFAPHVVAECLRGLSFTAALYDELGIKTQPSAEEERGDIIQTLRFSDAEGLVRFCQAVQAASPVDAFAVPIPGSLPGYSHQVVMAAGAFIQGSSIELSADGPLAEPYTAYMQGGLVYEQVKLAALLALEKINL